MISAKAQNARVEVASLRTPTTATYANPNGTWTVEAYSGAVRSKEDDDNWVPVDADLEKSDAGFEPKATPFDATFSDGGDKTVGSLTSENNASIQVGWPTKLPVPHADGGHLTYPGAAPGADLVVDSKRDGFSYSLVLDHAPAADAAPLEYRIPLKFGGAEADVKPDGSIVLKDGKNRVGTMTAPVMWDDANKAPDGQRHAVDATVEGEGESRTLVLKPSMSYLRDPSTTYPVTVDPTVSLNVAYDTWVDSTSPTASQISSPELRVGSNNSGTNVDRSYLYFDFSSLSSMPAAVVSSAQLQVSNFETGACAGSAVRMSQVTGSYNIATMTWATQPTTTSTGSSTSTGSFGAAGCTSEGIMTFDATAIFNAWLGGSFNWGVQLKADSETASSGFRKLRSVENGDVAKAPKLVMTYNSYPYKPMMTAVSPGDLYGSTTYARSVTPTLSTVVSDPDGGTVRGYFEIYNSSGTTLLWSGTSAWGASDDRVSTTVSSGILAGGGTYIVAAYSQDATLKSQAAQLKTFTVDTSAPSTTITNTTYTNGTWTTTLPSSNDFTLDGPADTASFDTLIDGIPRLLPANSSGDFTPITMYPVAAWHTIEATAIDKAGNHGPTATFNFGSGAPGFTTPQQNDASTSSFNLDISAPPNSTGAVLSWKLASETTWRSVNHVTKAGSAWSGSVSTSGGRTITGQLVWGASAEETSPGVAVAAPASLNLRACFHYASAADMCTYIRTLKLLATGNQAPTATNPTPVPGEIGTTSSAGPALNATVSDPDGGNVRAKFELLDEGSQSVWSAMSNCVPSGSVASVQVPAATLVKGVNYTLRVTANDGTLDSTPVEDILVYDDGAETGNTSAVATTDRICEAQRDVDADPTPCDAGEASIQTDPVETITPARAQTMSADYLNAPGAETIAQATLARPIYCRNWYAYIRGATWKEQHEGRFCYDGKNVWVAKYGAYHQCDQGWSVGYDITITNCTERYLLNPSATGGYGYQNWDYFKVHAVYKMVPIYWSHKMHTNVYPSGNMYFY